MRFRLAFLVAVAAVGPAPAGAGPGATSWPVHSDLPLAKETPGAVEATQLRSEIARLQEELHNESMRIEAAQAAEARANASWKADEKEAEHVRAQLASATAKVKEARQEAAKAQAQLKALETSVDHKVGPVAAWMAELPHQKAIAVGVGIMGLLSIVGPSTYTRAFLAISGSAVGGLMVGGCYGFFAGGPSWFGCVRQLLEGTGPIVGYGAWAAMLALGIVRWLVGFNCAIYACVDEVEVDVSGRMVRAGNSSLQKPLLGNEAAGSGRGQSAGAAANGSVMRDFV